MEPALPTVVTALPFGSGVTIPDIEIVTVPIDALPEIANWTFATVPEDKAFVFAPKTKTRIPPVIGLMNMLLEAFVAAVPAEILLYEIEEENVRSNCRVLTEVLFAEKPTGTVTVAPGRPETDPTAIPAD
jgi:hypothetical protein